MKDSTFIFLIITIIVIFILHVRFKFAEPQEFPKIKVSGVSLMSKSTENYVPWKTEMFTPDIYKSMSKGVEIKFNISIDSGASTIKELSVTRTRKEYSKIEETKTIKGPFENEKPVYFTFIGTGEENFVGEHIFNVKYKLPYSDTVYGLDNVFSTTIVGADLSIATEILKDSAHTLRFETKTKITFDKNSPFEYKGNFSRLGPQTGWEYFNYTILPDERDKAVEICAKKCNEITEGDGCPGFAIDFRYPRDGIQNIVNCMPYIAKQVHYAPPGREECRRNPEKQEPDDGKGPCSTENVMGTYEGEGGLYWRDLSISDEPAETAYLSIGTEEAYEDVGRGYCNTGEIYASDAWALLETGETHVQASFDSPLYNEYLRRGVEKCNADENCTHVSVWQNAGYRLYNSIDDCANKHDTGGIVKSWKKHLSIEESRAAAEEAKARAEAEAEADRKAKEEADRKAKEEAEAKAKEEADRKAKEEAERERINNLGTYIVDNTVPLRYRGNFSRLEGTGWGYVNYTIPSNERTNAVNICADKCDKITEGDGCPGFAIDFRYNDIVNCMPYIARPVPGREQCRHHPELQNPPDGQGQCSTEYVMGTHEGQGGLYWRESGNVRVESDSNNQSVTAPSHCKDENGDILQDPLIEGSNTKYDPNKTYNSFQPGYHRHYENYCIHHISNPIDECARHLCYKTAFGDYGKFSDTDENGVPRGGGLCAGECWDRFKKEPYQEPVSPDCKMSGRSLTYEDWIGWKRWIPPEIYGWNGELTPSSDPGREKAWIAQGRLIEKAVSRDEKGDPIGKKCCEQVGGPKTCEDPPVGEKLFQIEQVVSRSDESAVTIRGDQHLIDYFYDKNKFTGKCENKFDQAYGETGLLGDTKDCSPEAQHIARSLEKYLYELTTDEDKESYLGSAITDPDAWEEIINDHINAWEEIINDHINDYYESGGPVTQRWNLL
jgi:hypothetical protein